MVPNVTRGLTEFLSCCVTVWSILLLTEKKKVRQTERESTQLDQVNTVQQVYLLQQVT